MLRRAEHVFARAAFDDLAVAEDDDVVVLRDGEIVERGRSAEVFRAPKHPYTAALLRAVPRLPAA